MRKTDMDVHEPFPLDQVSYTEYEFKLFGGAGSKIIEGFRTDQIFRLSSRLMHSTVSQEEVSDIYSRYLRKIFRRYSSIKGVSVKTVKGAISFKMSVRVNAEFLVHFLFAKDPIKSLQ